MYWKLKDIIQETNHPFLNFYTLVYEVENNGNKKEYRYFMASRKSKDKLYALTKDKRPDGVLIPCYYVDEKGEVSFLITSQFRPPLNRVVTSIPAGLLDEGDDLFSAAKREALEEGGVIIDNLELICPTSPTSSGLSDEVNAIVLGQIVGFKENHLEEFEDISYRLVKVDEVEKMLEDDNYFFAMNVRLLYKYLILRFKGRKR
ncbi:MAG: NUDIX hydrolase [Bacilli bacterium]|nr:NUDIX hydrolase [Bacilli bacterium]